MAEPSSALSPPSGEGITPEHVTLRRPNNRQQLNKLYALPAPLRTFPLPTFVPHNPISLLCILYSWVSQTIRPPFSHFDSLYIGQWSMDTRSVHVTDHRSIRGLWEQGFYGKGNLSRSEPSWMEKKKAASGQKSRTTIEELTQIRRVERQQNKWERARKEREAIEQRRSQEAEEERAAKEGSLSSQDDTFHDSDTSLTLSDDTEPLVAKALRIPPAPVGPLELLVLPNSALDLYEYQHSASDAQLDEWYPMPVERLADEVAAVAQSLLERKKPVLLEEDHTDVDSHTNGYSLIESNQKGKGEPIRMVANGHANINKYSASNVNEESTDGSVHSDETVQTSNFTPNGPALVNSFSGSPKIKRQKSVRFSPTVEQNTFIQSEPPSPDRSLAPTNSIPTAIIPVTSLHEEGEVSSVKNQEHFQLTMEEAFFLSYALGALSVIDPASKSPIPNKTLFKLFRQSSSFPPLSNPSISPDDSFMLNYVVYHHYRSLGWVVRGGSKFSCDFMLYNRGPVFTHAEFAVLILPSYNDEYWSRDESLKNYVRGKERRTWAWLHCINRVITQVKKTMILVYVDIPAPFDEEKDLTLIDIFGRYQVREFILKRWSPNRQRGEGNKSRQ